MSFHGGLAGVLIAIAIFAKRRGRAIADVFDFMAPLPGLGLFAGRFGNFINGELCGKITGRSVGVHRQRRGFRVTPRSSTRRRSKRLVLPTDPAALHRQASTTARARRVVPGAVFYGVFRFAIEFVRISPDENMGEVAATSPGAG